MKCAKCGFENMEGAGFCGQCGEDLSSDSIMNTLDENAENVKKKSKKEKKKKNDGEKPKKNIKAIVISCVAAVGVAAGVIAIMLNLPSEGEKVLKNVPIGRDLAYAEAKTECDFNEKSKYDSLSSVPDFDNICEGNLTIKVEGVSFPEWAIAVELANDETINRVVYYDFSQLQKDWKGHHSSEKIEQSVIEYGMKRKAVDKALGFTPYSIIKEIDNTVTNIYRYYYSDEATGNDIVCNFCVVFNDVDESVKDVYVTEIEYIGLMTSVK